MRVIAGALRGRRLESPRWSGLRPSSDRLRETLFNILAPRIEGARVLDLCAGTGAVGIEALSRGAGRVAFVDADPRACALIAKNLANCGLTERYTIHRATVEQASNTLREAFDIVFLDPPYAEPALDRFVEWAARAVAVGGMLVVEHDRRRGIATSASPLEHARTIRSGDSVLTCFSSRDAADVTAADGVDAGD